jgi:hypothetical protein
MPRTRRLRGRTNGGAKKRKCTKLIEKSKYWDDDRFTPLNRSNITVCHENQNIRFLNCSSFVTSLYIIVMIVNLHNFIPRQSRPSSESSGARHFVPTRSLTVPITSRPALVNAITTDAIFNHSGGHGSTL